MTSSDSSLMEKFSPNLDKYFARIKYEGSREPTLRNLKSILWRHLLAIPFENLNIHMGDSISVDPITIEQKLVGNKRGGYCYEQNSHLCNILRALGLSVTPILARVMWQRSPLIVSGKTHFILRVECEGRSWLVDVSFCNMGSLIPLDIFFEGEQTTPNDVRRILQVGNVFIHQIKLQGNWLDLYKFNLDESLPCDWEIGNHYCSTHPNSMFTKNIIVSRFSEEYRYLLVNKDFSIRPLSRFDTNVSGEGEVLTEKREIKSEREYFDILKQYFLLDLLCDDYVTAVNKKVPSLCPPGTTWEE